jgi:hypothetical protein
MGPGGSSIRRIVLGTAFALLVLLDVSTLYRAVSWIALGSESGGLGLPNIGIGLAAVQLPVFLALLWATFKVWYALRDS